MDTKQAGDVFIRTALVLVAGAALTGTLFFLILYLSPFIFGFIIALMLLPFVNRLERTFGWPRTFCVLVSMLILFLLLLTFATFAAVEIAAGLLYLSAVLPAFIKETVLIVNTWMSGTLMPLYERFTELIATLDGEQQKTVVSSLQSITGEAAQKAGEFIQVLLNSLADLLLALPNTVTVMIFSLLSAFFITKDWPLIEGWYKKAVPPVLDSLLASLKKEWKRSVLGFFIAQCILVAMTGVIILTGFLIIGIEHAVTAALLLALIDFLPYLGTGIVFVPWILYSFFTGDWFMSIGLSIIYAVVIVQRQIAEPRVLSRHLGVHPIPLLITLFLSYQWLGFAGLLLGPAILILVQSVIRAGVFHTIRDFILDSKERT
ncbi:sporulation integral membrane protein YtvI [Alteribacter lacisalsi]|uniref:Sporulation integral membrane protein YtvI n=1 Tax=Alteribacter lacisalsi TaxID=2045244 RepID=A0A2W0HK87_9BACI|nr:sporulation integral membrane protein YtvI [Alteribacter lacisalsi]PYZ97229.1 sporulation integral membrane protein YtvI [Alteribacter lacisalsi]